MKILIFDTETTGLPLNYRGSIYDSNNWPHIVQLSYILFDCKEKKIIANINRIIKVDTIPKSSTLIHNITEQISKEHGVNISDALKEFNIYAKQANKLVAHNINFDKKMIIVECIRNKIMSIFTKQPSLYCTMKNATEICAIEKTYKDGTKYFKYPTLSELHNKLFNSIPNGTHNAQNDIIICLRCYFYLIYKIDLLHSVDIIKSIL